MNFLKTRIGSYAGGFKSFANSVPTYIDASNRISGCAERFLRMTCGIEAFTPLQVSFSIISVITGIPSLFLYGLVSMLCMNWGCPLRYYQEYWWARGYGMGMGRSR